MQNKKRFLIDTSVILDSPFHLISLYQNGENELFISDIILKELNKHKEDGYSEKGFFAREIIRALDKGSLITKKKKDKKSYQKDSIHSFKCILEGSTEPIIISIINRELYKNEKAINDFKIIEIAKDYGLDLITNDIALKIIALSNNIHSESLKKGSVDNPEQITYQKEYKYSKESYEKVKQKILSEEKDWTQIILKEHINGLETGKLKFFIKKQNTLEEIKEEDFNKYRVQPLNIEQKFYAKMLSSNFQIMVVTGSTGSGKTLLALNEGIKRVKDSNDPIDGIVYLRNTVTANDAQSELGFRKGDQNQKLSYFAYPLFGAINFIIGHTIGKDKTELRKQSEANNSTITKEEYTQEFMKEYNIEIMDIAHARGVTITNKFVIFDEGQNATNATAKLIGTRIGKNSKLIIMGDFKQVDHPYLTQTRNALVTMLKKAESQDMIAGIQLKKTIRSEIANWFQENI